MLAGIVIAVNHGKCGTLCRAITETTEVISFKNKMLPETPKLGDRILFSFKREYRTEDDVLWVRFDASTVLK